MTPSLPNLHRLSDDRSLDSGGWIYNQSCFSDSSCRIYAVIASVRGRDIYGGGDRHADRGAYTHPPSLWEHTFRDRCWRCLSILSASACPCMSVAESLHLAMDGCVSSFFFRWDGWRLRNSIGSIGGFCIPEMRKSRGYVLQIHNLYDV